jgi:hypothetical protein
MIFEPGMEMTPTETILGTEPERPSRVTRKVELLRNLSPEKRALFEEIVARRERIGPVNIDVVTILRELREDG